MRMQKRKFRIGELANHLDVERFVIRFWEKEFGIKAHRSTGGQRFYDETDLKKFQTIKELLYEKKFTIAGAKQILAKIPARKHANLETILASHVTTFEAPSLKHSNDEHPDEQLSEALCEQLMRLRKSLVKLRNLL